MKNWKIFPRTFLFVLLIAGLCAGLATPRLDAALAAPREIAATTVVISEFRFRGPSGANDEFIELYNPTGSSILIGGLEVRGTNTSGTSSIKATITSGISLLPGQYYLLTNSSGYSGSVTGDQTYSVGIVDDGGVAITTAGGASIIDQAGITNCVTCYFEGTVLGSLGSSNLNRSYERKHSGCLDDGNNSTDFALEDPSTPQNLSSTPVVCTDLRITVVPSSLTPIVGSPVTFTITVFNDGPNNATNVTVKDILPAGLTYSSDDSLGNYISGTGMWTAGTISSGGSAVINIIATVASPGAKINSAEIWSSDQVDPDSFVANSDISEDDYASVTVTPPAVGSADLSVTKTVNNAAPNVGESVVFTITVSNAGPDTATGVIINDDLPAGMAHVSNTGSGAYNTTTGEWLIASLTSGSSITLKITARVDTGGAKTNTASVQSAGQTDPDGSDNSASVTVTPNGGVATLTLTQDTPIKSTTTAGQTVLIINVTNSGPFSATNVIVKDDLPTGLTYVSDNSNGAYSKDTNMWSVGAISAGQTKTLRITVKVDTSGTMINWAEVWSADQAPADARVYGNGSTTEDDDASATVQTADLSLTKSMDNVTPSLGQDVVFTIRVTNDGPDHATNVEVKDILPSNYTYVSDDSTSVFGSSYTSSTGIWVVGTINSGSSRTLKITATMNSSSVAVNWAEIWKSDQVDVDSVPGNSSTNTDDDSSAPSADLRVEQAVSSFYPGLNTNFTIVITVTNDGTVGATNVQVKDKLPSGMAYKSYVSSVGTYTSSSGIWTVGTLPTNTPATLTITAQLTNNGLYTNWAEVWRSDLPDTDSTPANSSTTEDDDASTQVYYRPVLINEVAWSGTTASTSDQWIELYNLSSATIDLTGWTLTTTKQSPNITITLSGTIAPGGYFLLERDNNSTVSDVTANQIYTGALSFDGATITLRDSSSNIIDTANKQGSSNALNPWPKGATGPNYPSMERQGGANNETDAAWVTNTGVTRNGKTANGGIIYGTPGKKNSTGVLPTPTRVPPTSTPIPPAVRPVINEFLARPGFDWNQDGSVDVFDEFIEIKNIGVVDVKLADWQLDDEEDGGSEAYYLPDITLKPGQRVIFYGLETNILLSDGGDTVRLINPDGKIYDAYTYSIVRSEDQSVCRLPDGGGSWYQDCIPSPNLTNTREGTVPSMPENGGAESTICELPDTLPPDFLFAECRGYGANIWYSFYWDQFGWLGDQHVPENTSKWDSFVE